MSAAGPPIRVGDPDDLLAAVRLLDAANLDVEAATVEERLDAGRVLLVDDPPAGVLVARPAEPGAHVEAVAVRTARRGRGLGSALVEAAADRWGRLTADCDPRVRPFYESLGFAIEEREGRLWGVRD
jgi:GNAT superfamily N-acetyltransferase